MKTRNLGPLSLLGLLVVSGAALSACASTKTSDKTSDKPAPAAASSATPSSTAAAAPAKTPDASPAIGGYAISDSQMLELGYRRDWTAFPYVAPGERVVFLAPSRDAILVQESGSTVSALEPATGAVRWANELASPLTRFVSLSRQGERVLASSDAELFILSPVDGSILGRQRYERVVNTAPIVQTEAAVYGTRTGHLLSHRTGLGVTRWSFLLRGSIDRAPVVVSGSEDDAVIGVVAQSGDYLFVNARSGRPIGRGSIFGPIDTDPIAAQGLMIVAGRDQSLWALRTDGEVAWRIRTDQPLSRQPATDGTTVWCQLAGEGLSAVDAASGRILWSNRVVEGSVIGIRSGNLLVWNGTLALLIDAQRGDIIRSYVLPDTRMLITDQFVDGNLYAVSDNGVVVRYVPRS